jgi:EpsI family protein
VVIGRRLPGRQPQEPKCDVHHAGKMGRTRSRVKLRRLVLRPGHLQMSIAATRAAAAAADRPAGKSAVWVALAVVAFVVGLHAADMSGLVAQWRTSFTYSQGFLVAALVPWLIWRERGAIGFEGRVPMPAVVLLLAGLEISWLLAHGAHIGLIGAALLPAIAWVALLGVLGPRSAGRLAFPLAWFWCAVSVWDVLGGFLQRVTAVVDRVLLAVLGIPALRDGTTISVPAGTFEIAAACSGLNFFVVAITIAALFGQVSRWSAGRRVAYIGIAALIAMVSNWVRVCLIIAIGQWTQMETALVREGHYSFGWWLFAAILGLFLYLTHRWDRSVPHPVPDFAEPAASNADIARRAAIILILLAAGPAWASWQDARIRSARAPTIELPAARDGWSGPEAAAPTVWTPTFVGATVRRTGAYHRADVTVVVDVTYYASQRPGAKLVGYPSNPDGPQGSTVLERHHRKLDPGPGGSAGIEEIIVRMGTGQRWRVWQWFQVGASVTAGPAGLKLLEGFRGLTGTAGSAALSLAVACPGDCRDDRDGGALADFGAAMQDSLVRVASGGGSGGQ